MRTCLDNKRIFAGVRIAAESVRGSWSKVSRHKRLFQDFEVVIKSVGKPDNIAHKLAGRSEDTYPVDGEIVRVSNAVHCCERGGPR